MDKLQFLVLIRIIIQTAGSAAASVFVLIVLEVFMAVVQSI